jgi:hypothetical protein
MTIIGPDANSPFLDDAGRMVQRVRAWVNAVSRDVTISGNGSPEGVVDALPKTRYMDESGTAGSILYIKRDAQVGGDKKLGWILV